MQAGNARYLSAADLPEDVCVFPLKAALLLPGGRLPLNIFEPRYLEMVDDALSGRRLIGVIQPRLDGSVRADGEPELCNVGCLGRITSLMETGDGRYVIALHGVCRFRVVEEAMQRQRYRVCRIAPFLADLIEGDSGGDVDRAALLKTFRAYLKANELDADWESVSRADNQTLVNALSMMAPYGPVEKQALLEAPDLKTRAETLIAMTEMALAQGGDDGKSIIQ